MSHADNALTFGGDPEQHIARDNAWEEFNAKHAFANRYNSIAVSAIRAGFEAGWAARGAVNYPENKSAEAVDLRCAACKSED